MGLTKYLCGSFCRFASLFLFFVSSFSLISCGDDSISCEEEADKVRSVVSQDTVADRSAALKKLLADCSSPAVTGCAYAVSSETANIPVRFNASKDKMQASQLILLMTDNPKKKLEFGTGCKEVYVMPEWLDSDGICVLYVQGLVPQSTYKYRLFYRYNNAEQYMGDVLMFETLQPQMFNADAVDLGLTVCWASSNLGASRSYQTGVYYYYGVPDFEAGRKLSSATGVAGTDSDPSYVELGDGWSSPTSEQMLELINKCDWQKSEENGVEGYKVFGRGDYYGNYIFIPLAGYYNTNDMLVSRSTSFMLWSGSISESSDRAYTLSLNADGSCTVSRHNIASRLPIRPVRVK